MNLYNDDIDDDDDDDHEVLPGTAVAPKTAAPRSHKKKKVAKVEVPLSDFLMTRFTDPKNGKLAAKFVEKMIKKHPEVNFEQLQEFLSQFSGVVDGIVENTSRSTRLSVWEPPV